MVGGFGLFSQGGMEALPDADSNPSKLSLYSISYPEGLHGQLYKNFRLNYVVSDSFEAQLQAFYDSFGTRSNAKSSAILKVRVTKKSYLFAGPEAEYGTNPVSGESELLRVNLNLGVGYEVNPDFLLELGYHPELGNPRNNDNTSQSQGKQNTFSLRASF